MSARPAAARPAPRVVLVTGAAGFIGANAVTWLLREQAGVSVVSFDAMTYAAHPGTLAMAAAGGEERHHFVKGDVRDAAALDAVLTGRARDAQGRSVPTPDAIWHLAAETHVDRSILAPDAFVETNVLGTARLVEAVRRADATREAPLRLVHVGTDEVYGSLRPDEAPFAEDRALAPSSPYAASKAAADLLVQAWARTYGLDATVTRCSNNYGPYQFPEKLLPLLVTRALAGRPLPVYGDGLQVRDWLHAEDHAAALWAVTLAGAGEGRVYNIGAAGERTNLEMVRAVLAALGRDESLITHVRDRPAHDRRYAMDASRLRTETSWRPRVGLEAGIAATVRWYVANEAWWRPVLAEASRVADAMYLGTSA